MKKTISLIVCLAVLALVLGFTAQGTTQEGLTKVRSDGPEDSTSMTNAFNYRLIGDFANKSSAVWTLPGTDNETAANAVKFYFTTDGLGKTFNAVCYGYTAINGPSQMVCTIAATGGNMKVVSWPDTGLPAIHTRTWVDKIEIATYWPKSVTTGSSGGGDEIVSCLWFDGMGCKHFKWYVWGADGSTGVEAGYVSIWGSYF